MFTEEERNILSIRFKALQDEVGRANKETVKARKERDEFISKYLLQKELKGKARKKCKEILHEKSRWATSAIYWKKQFYQTPNAPKLMRRALRPE